MVRRRQILSFCSVALIAALCRPLSGQDVRIERIAFFGQEGIATEPVRQALPFREGGTVSVDVGGAEEWEESVVEAVRGVIGQDPTDVAAVCCGDAGGVLVYIGLPGASSHSVPLNEPPAGPERFPAEFVMLYREVGDATREAVIAGRSAEDDSAGYALAVDFPPLRSVQVEVREYALANEPLIYQVLRSSSDPVHRAMAAFAVGYAGRSEEQVSTLVSASFDADGGVRNEAVRALGVILRSDPEASALVPAERFIELIGSGVWEDRNKASRVLLELTAERDPVLLTTLESRVLTPLREMAHWPRGHSGPALIMLGRIAGIEDERLFELLGTGQSEIILEAFDDR